MNDPIDTLQADIGFLKALALEGRAAPWRGGSILVAAGAIFAAASVLDWAIQTGHITASPWALSFLWGGATVVFLVALRIIRRRTAKADSANPANRAVGLAWMGVGWTIFTLAASAYLAAWRSQSPLPFLLLPSAVMALYGLGWTVVAAASRERWIWLTAAGSYAAAIVMAAFCTSPALSLFYAAALFLLAVVPGVALMRQAAKAV
ncbi:MAG: hypothetical protein M3T55_08340 [Pseudomonadota bacterium]|nr:hypothetical protein [Pseudomonadota bacterium]